MNLDDTFKLLGIQVIELVEGLCPDCQIPALHLAKARGGDAVQHWLDLNATARSVGHRIFHSMVLKEAAEINLSLPEDWHERCVFFTRTPSGRRYYLKKDAGTFRE